MGHKITFFCKTRLTESVNLGVKSKKKYHRKENNERHRWNPPVQTLSEKPIFSLISSKCVTE